MQRTRPSSVGVPLALWCWIAAIAAPAYPSLVPDNAFLDRAFSDRAASDRAFSDRAASNRDPSEVPPIRRGSMGCLPTCPSDDGRFLTLSSGNPLGSLSSQELTLAIVVEPGGPFFEVGIFDGDSGANDARGASHWDKLPGHFRYSVLADTDRDGVGDILALPAIDSSIFPDNEWVQLEVPRMREAQGPSGNYFYVLVIENTDPSQTVLNAFKVRADGFLTIPGGQPFGIFPAITTLADAAIIYPQFPATAPTTYDGSFRLFFDVPESPTELVIWDGDFDFGSIDGSVTDSDDPSTPSAPFVPPWDNGLARPEGVAIGQAGTTGSPADDGDSQGTGIYLVRSPNPTYRLRAPNGNFFTNDNPSGHQEWEHFRVLGPGGDPSPWDTTTRALTSGLYSLEITGLDLQNSVFFRLDHPVICTEPSGLPCVGIPETVLLE